jgi:hypothetical protein
MGLRLYRRTGVQPISLTCPQGVPRWALTAVVAGLILAPWPLAPMSLVAQQGVFRATTDAVWVTATVIDKDGRLVTDLTKDDFEIRDNGNVRPITVFRR